MKGQQTREIGGKIALFIRALGHITYKVATQITLPGSKRKGNLLSSLLLLFISLNDLFTTFSWGFSIRFILRWKHYDRAALLIKKSALFIGCLLFLLSSFEWSYPTAPELRGVSAVVRSELQRCDAPLKQTISYRLCSLRNITPPCYQGNISAGITAPGKKPLIVSKIFLRHCNFRI